MFTYGLAALGRISIDLCGDYNGILESSGDVLAFLFPLKILFWHFRSSPASLCESVISCSSLYIYLQTKIFLEGWVLRRTSFLLLTSLHALFSALYTFFYSISLLPICLNLHLKFIFLHVVNGKIKIQVCLYENHLIEIQSLSL